MNERKSRQLLAAQLVLIAAPLTILFLYGGALMVAVAVGGLTEWNPAANVAQVLLVFVCLLSFWVLSIRFLINGRRGLTTSNGFLWSFMIIGVIYALLGTLFLAAWFAGSSIANALAFFRLGVFGLPLIPAVVQLLLEERSASSGPVVASGSVDGINSWRRPAGLWLLGVTLVSVVAGTAASYRYAPDRAELEFRFVKRINDAVIDRAAINRYGADQRLWGDRAEAQALYEPSDGENHLLYFVAEYQRPQIHDDPTVLETRQQQLLLEVNADERIVAGLHSPVVFDEVPHAVWFHYFFDGEVDLPAQLDLRTLPWTGFLPDVYLSEPTGVVYLGE